MASKQSELADVLLASDKRVHAHGHGERQQIHTQTPLPPPPPPPPAPPRDGSLLGGDRKARVVSDMRYWSEGVTAADYPAIQAMRARYAPQDGIERFLVFCTWQGGFNNERMSLELAFVLALLTGRTLVLPPKYPLYLLEPSSFTDYFDPAALAIPGLVKTAEFGPTLKHLGIAPPDSDVVWSGDPVWTRIRKGDDVFFWNTIEDNREELVFPELPGHGTVDRTFVEAWSRDGATYVDYFHNASLRDARTIYIPQRNLFGHFYVHFALPDAALRTEVLRAVRDHVHFVDSVFEASAAIVAKLPPSFNCVHVRRGDFQYKDISLVTAEAMVKEVAELVPPTTPLWLATDDVSGKTCVDAASAKVQVLPPHVNPYNCSAEPWRNAYQLAGVFLLKEFQATLDEAGVGKKHLGLIEQLVCTQAEVFVGSRLSTFSGYIVRLRGYMQRHMGRRNTETYFVNNAQSMLMTERAKGLEGARGEPLPTWRAGWSGLSWAREWGESWWSLTPGETRVAWKDVGELAA